MRYGLPDYEAGRKVSFFKDRTMIDSFKVLITQLLNRVNTVNGRRYGDDPAVLAWQTGNEMRLGSDRPAPGAWTDEICGVRCSVLLAVVVSGRSVQETDLISLPWAAAHQKSGTQHLGRRWLPCKVGSRCC